MWIIDNFDQIKGKLTYMYFLCSNINMHANKHNWDYFLWYYNVNIILLSKIITIIMYKTYEKSSMFFPLKHFSYQYPDGCGAIYHPMTAKVYKTLGLCLPWFAMKTRNVLFKNEDYHPLKKNVWINQIWRMIYCSPKTMFLAIIFNIKLLCFEKG